MIRRPLPPARLGACLLTLALLWLPGVPVLPALPAPPGVPMLSVLPAPPGVPMLSILPARPAPAHSAGGAVDSSAALAPLVAPVMAGAGSRPFALVGAVFRAHAAPASLRLRVWPTRLDLNRGALLTAQVSDGAGRPLQGAVVTLSGAGLPLSARSAHGRCQLRVRPPVLGRATLLASYRGLAPARATITIVAGPPGSVLAIQRGLSIQPPHQRPHRGRVGDDLLDADLAATAPKQRASFAFRDGSLVDLNERSSVRIIDPLHERLSAGELFYALLTGSGTHHVFEVNDSSVVTYGTRLDLRYDARRRRATITVIQGRVRVTRHGYSVTVGAGQQTVIPAHGRPGAPKPVDVRPLITWVNSLPAAPPPPPVLPPAPRRLLPPPGLTPLSGGGARVARSVTWPAGQYALTGTVEVAPGATLTVAAGAVVRMAPSASLLVRGQLVVQGSAATPVLFGSAAAQPQAGDWGAIVVDGGRATLSGVYLFDGGRRQPAGAVLVVRQGGHAQLRRGSILSQMAGAGLYVDDGSQAGVDGALVDGTGRGGASQPAAAASMPPDSVSGLRALSITPGAGPVLVRDGTLHHAAAWGAGAGPLQVGRLQVAARASLTLAAGATLQMRAGGALTVAGTLAAQGTARGPVLLTSAATQPRAGNWQGVQLEPGAVARLRYTQILFAGGAAGTRAHATAPPAAIMAAGGTGQQVSNSAIAASAGDGIYVVSDGMQIVANSFQEDVGYALSLPSADSARVHGNSFGQGQRAIEVREQVAQTPTPTSIPSATSTPTALPAATSTPTGVSTATSTPTSTPTGILNVCPSGPPACPYTRIQDAVNAAAPGDMISVAAGTYPETVTIPLSVTLAGAGAGRTIVDGRQSGAVVTVNVSATVAISGVTIQNGSTSGDGGGILNAGTLTLAGSAIISNTASGQVGDGGGIYNSGALTVTTSTISGDSAAEGGGIENAAGATLAISNSTISGNVVSGGGGVPGTGGGIDTHSTLTVSDSTVSGNSANGAGGGLWTPATTNPPALTTTILAGNRAPDSPDCFGTLRSGGYNLLGIGDGCGLTNGQNGDQVGSLRNPRNALLGPLQPNGGPTFTLAPMAGSPAIDAVGPGSCALAADQRGQPRPDAVGDKGFCDVGAVEVQEGG